ncbi:MAG: hypothetical protein U0797_07390 [Gemmataceae bacterium]
MRIKPRQLRFALGAALLTGLVGLAGCGDKVAQQVGEMNKSNIQRVANLYAGFQNLAGAGRGPKDEAELTKFVKEYDPAKLKMMGVDPNDFSKVLTSERDGKPFKVRYNVGGGRGAVAPVVFEQDGKDGKKQVGFTGGKVEEVGEAEYQAYWSGKGTTGPAGGPGGAPGGDSRPMGRPQGAPTGPPK